MRDPQTPEPHPRFFVELTVSEHGWRRGCDWHQQRVLRVIVEGKTRAGGGQQRIFHFTRCAVHVHCDVEASTVRDDTDIRGCFTRHEEKKTAAYFRLLLRDVKPHGLGVHVGTCAYRSNLVTLRLFRELMERNSLETSST